MGVRRALEASFTSVYLANQEEILGPDLGKKKEAILPISPYRSLPSRMVLEALRKDQGWRLSPNEQGAGRGGGSGFLSSPVP